MAESYVHRNKPSHSIKGDAFLEKPFGLSPSQEGLCSMELISYYQTPRLSYILLSKINTS
jgi:hypothetical protein